MTKTEPRYTALEQRPLERAVCKTPCVLLSGHSGPCRQSNGKGVKR